MLTLWPINCIRHINKVSAMIDYVKSTEISRICLFYLNVKFISTNSTPMNRCVIIIMCKNRKVCRITV